MSNRNTSRHLGCALLVGMLSFVPWVAFGADLPTGTFIVRPAKAEVILAPGEEKVVVIRLTNGTPSPLRIETSFEDIAPEIQSTPDSNPIRLLGDAAGGASALSRFLSVPSSTFDLLSLQEVDVPVTVRIPKDTPPGGRYGSAVFTFRPSFTHTGSEQANISVANRIAVPLYVRVTGAVKEEGKLAKFGVFNDAFFVSSVSSDSPLRFQVAYENTGAVYENPHGTITTTDLFGRTTVTPVDPFAVLPGATRMREIDLFGPLALNYYTAELSLARGYGEEIDTAQVRFIVLPSSRGAVLILLGAVLLFFIIRRSLRLSRHSVS